MGTMSRNLLLVLLLAVVLFASHAHAFGAGNIASISSVEGKNWRHGDIEDLLKTVTCIKHHKWSSMMVKRAYFGNWLRDYSQAMDTGALKKAPPETIRILVWLLSFLGFGYATAEFEVTSERLGVYRPEEHIDNPKNYNDDQDARPYDPRLRAPVRPIEIQVDPETGMKNYIANGKGDWATSAAFVKYSFTQSIHYGRQYINGSSMLSKGKDEDLCEALRLLGQGLHCLEDFGAHTNYVELALIELGHRDVFAHVGRGTEINVRGKRIWPLVTGTFGMVDFYHSVIGEATDHFTQSEVSEMDNAMGMAEQAASSSNPLMTLVKLLSKVPGAGGLADEAQRLSASSKAEARRSNIGGASRGIDDYNSSGAGDYSSSRGVDDYSSTRAGPGDYPGAGYHGATTHGNYGSYNQPQPQHQGGYNDYNQGYNSYNQAAPQQWGQPPPQHDLYNQAPSWQQSLPQHNTYDQGQTGNQPQQHDSYNQGQQWNQPPPPQHNPYNQGQSWNQQPSQSNQWQQPLAQSQHDQYNPGSSWQQTGAPLPTHAAQPQAQAVASIPQAAQAQGQVVKPPAGLPGMPDFDPAKTIKQIYPILVFRDKVVRTISSIIEKIPGLEALVDRIVETLTVFIFSLLAPFVRPVLNALQKTLQSSSEGVTEWNKKHQYEVWEDPHCSDPTHSMLSKDHFSNILNEPAGKCAGEILKFIAPRVLYAWEHPEVPVDRVMSDVESIFHHPALRDERGNECHRNMFNVVRMWAQQRDRNKIDGMLNAQAVREGKNHIAGVNDHAGHGSSMGAHGNVASAGMTGAPAGGYGSYLQSAEHVVEGFTGIGGHQGGHGGGYGGHSSSNQGGLGGLLGQAESFLGGNKPHHGGSNSGMGGLLGQAESFLGGGGSHNKPSHGGGGGLNDMLSMASKLPGVGNYASSFNQFNKISNAFGDLGGKRELPGEERDLPDGSVHGPARPAIPGDDGDYGDSDKYLNLGLSSVGGASDFYESALRSRNAAPTPSPGPMPVPSGYESYVGGQTSAYEGGQNAYGGEGQYQYQSSGYGQGYPSEQTGGYGNQRY